MYDISDVWDWLEKNHSFGEGYLVLGNYDNLPCVMFISDTDYSMNEYGTDEWREYPYNFYIKGRSYSHAISLALVEVVKIDMSSNSE